MADDDLYGILRELTAIRELLERDISSGRENYAAPYNDSFVRDIMSNSRNIQKKDSRTGQYVDTGELDAKSVKTAINDFLKMRDLSTSKSTIFVKKYVDEMKKTHDSYKANSLAQQVYFARAIDKLGKMLFEYSSGAYAKSPVLNTKKGMNNPLGAAFLKKIQAEFQVLHKTNSVVSKIAYLFETDLSGRKSRVRKFTEDLIEGLARSKFVGGALSDFVRLGSFFLASWVKNIPLIGKPLAAIVVALGSLGPMIVSSLISGLVSGFLPALGKLIFGKLLGGSSLRGSLGRLITGMIGRGATTALGSAAGAAAGTAGVTMIEGAMYTTSTASLGTGIATGGAAAGGAAAGGAAAGAAAGGATAIGLGTILIWLVAIVAAIAAIVAIAKNWDKIRDTIKHGWETITSGHFWSDLWEGFKNFWNGGGFNPDRNTNPNDIEEFNNVKEQFKKDHPVLDKMMNLIPGVSLFKDQIMGGAFSIANQFRKKQEIENNPIMMASPRVSFNHGQLMLDQGGVPLNLGELDRYSARREMESYRAFDKSTFDKHYEIVGSGLANLSNFSNDIKIRDMDKGGKEGALLYRGASDDLLSARKMLEARGMSPERAAMLQYTSGIASASSKHSKTGGHSNPLGYGFDLSTGKQWTKQDWDIALPVLREVWKKRGIDIFYEDERGHRFVNPTVENANFAHIHAEVAKSIRGNRRYKDARNRNWFGDTQLVDTVKDTGIVQVESEPIEIVEDVKPDEPQEKTVNESNNEFNQNGYTRIIQPDDSHIKPTFPIQKKSNVPQIDYTGDEMFSEVLRRTIDAAMRDAVQQ